MIKSIIILSSVLLFISCKRDNTNESFSAKTILNVSYGTDTAQRMDVYLPAGRSIDSTKALVIIHGGAWTTGDKSEFTPYIESITNRLPNYAVFNINYRLATLGGNFFPTQENDVQAAINIISSKAVEYNFNKNKIVLLDASAGAHLALLQAYKHWSPQVKAVVDLFGPTDMTALYNAQPAGSANQIGFQILLSATPVSNAAMYTASSPINFVSTQSPPTIILHGGKDPIVPIAQSTALKTKLQTAGVAVEMFTYPNEGHGWFGSTLEDSFDKIAAFLLTHVP